MKKRGWLNADALAELDNLKNGQGFAQRRFGASGGRLIKFKGKCASLAPFLGTLVVFASFSGGAAQAADECGVQTVPAESISCGAAVYGSGITYSVTGALPGLTLNLNNAGITSNDSVSVNGDATNSGDLIVNGTNFGTITAPSIFDAGLRAQNAGATGAAIVQMDAGTITLVGGNSRGITAINSSGTGSGLSTATMTGGSIVTTPSGASKFAIDAETSGSGNALASKTGGSITLNSVGSGGVFAVGRPSSTGTLTASWTGGTITVSADGSYAVGALQLGQGAATATMDSATATFNATGNNNTAVYVNSGATVVGSVTHTSTVANGTINMTGINASGAYVAITGGNTNGVARMTGGSFTASGDNNHGVFANGTGAASGNLIAEMTGGTITKNGTSFGSAIHAAHGSSAATGDATARMSGGTVVTNPATSHGLWAEITNTAGGAGRTATAEMTGGSLRTNGATADAIKAFNAVTGGGLGGDAIITATGGTARATGAGSDGAHASSSRGNTTVTIDTTVIGGSGTGYAVRTETQPIRSSTITINGSAVLSAASGLAISNNHGDSTTTVASGARITGAIDLGTNSDSLTFNGTNISTVTRMDGGDDTSRGDGDIDILTMNGVTGPVTGANVINWEEVRLNTSSTLSVTGPTWAVGDVTDPLTGVFLATSSELDALAALNLTGNVSIDATSRFTATGGGAGVYTVGGNTTNNGTITMQDGAVGDVLNVTGNYSGTGSLLVDIDTATDGSDRMLVAGSSSGPSTITVTNLSPATATGNDIPIVTVTGASSAADFSLVGGSFTVGALIYSLDYSAGTGLFFLKAAAAAPPASRTYAAAPNALLDGFAQMPTLEQRIGRSVANVGTVDVDALRGAWVRAYGSWGRGVLNDGLSFENSRSALQFGVNLPVEKGSNGQWVLGLTGQVGESSSDFTSATETGSVDAKGYGIGATATWYGYNGGYVDLQGQVNRISTDFGITSSGAVALGHMSTAASASIEVGQRFTLENGTTLIPQAQLVWSNIDGGTLVDSLGSTVDLGSNDRLVGRFGFAVEREWVGENGARNNFYGIGNILHEFENDTVVQIGGTSTASGRKSTFGEIGLGGTTTFDGGPSSNDVQLYGEVTYRQSFNGSDNYSLGATFGISARW